MKWITKPNWVGPNKQYWRGGRKIGRNEQCPCKSGKKFKKCHVGGEDE